MNTKRNAVIRVAIYTLRFFVLPNAAEPQPKKINTEQTERVMLGKLSLAL